MEFKQLESFAAVIKCNSFTKAAEKLYISQPTISTHIRALEEELNTRLILRTTKSIEVTPEGRKLFDYAESILQLRNRMVDECTGGNKKMLHLAASTIPSAYILPQVLPAYGEHNPDNYFVIHQSDSKGVIDGIQDGLFDVGLVGMEAQRDNLTCVEFCQDEMVLIAPVNEHFLGLLDRKVSAVEILRQEQVILREKGSGSRKSVDNFMEKWGITEEQLNIAARINDPEAIKNLVVGGYGVSIVSKRAAQNFLREKRLLAFDLPGDAGVRKLYVVYRNDRADDSRVKGFVNFLLRYYES